MNKIIFGNDGKGIWGKKIIEYLIQINNPNIKIEWTDNLNDCDIVIKGLFQPKHKSYNKPFITVSGESRYTSLSVGTHICDLTTLTNTNKLKNYFHVPYAVFADYDFKNIKKFTNTNRPFCVGYCASNPVPIREQLFKLLKNKNNDLVHGLGKCSADKNLKIKGGWNDVIETYSKYYFVMAMENRIADGYITEKIMNAYIAGSIPIYHGDSKMVKELFNPKSFICVNDFETLEECANYIFEIYNDKEKLINMMAEPIFNGNCPDILKLDLDSPPEYYKNIADLIDTYIKLN
jgi:hypothetical protein